MTEEDARIIAERFVKERSLDKCSFEAVRRIKENGPNGCNEWVVQFRFDDDEDGGYCNNRAIVIIDDVTGKPKIFESL